MTAIQPVTPEISIVVPTKSDESSPLHSPTVGVHLQSPKRHVNSGGSRAPAERPFSCQITLPKTQPRVTWSTDSRDSTTSESPIQCRVVQDRRTVFITSYVPPEKWDAETLQHISRLAEFPDGSEDGRPQPVIQVSAPVNKRDGEEASPTSRRAPLHSQRSRSCAKDDRQIRSYSPSGKETEEVKRSSYPNTPQTTYYQSQRKPEKSNPIYFYDRNDPYYGFTNFSSHKVMYKGKEYPTSEHLFQSFKFQEHRPLLAEHIRLFSDKPSVALSEARRFEPEQRKDWKDVNIAKMDIALWHKFDQHKDLTQELLSTGNSELIEDSDKDSFWGVGKDRKGRNELGKALMRLRDKLRASNSGYI